MRRKTPDLIVFSLISGKNLELRLIPAAPHKALRSLNFGPLRQCSAVIRLFAALTTMGGLLAWRQQITSRKRDERELSKFPTTSIPLPASSLSPLLFNERKPLLENLGRPDSLILFLCRALAGLTPSQERYSSSWSLCYLLTHLFITFLSTMNKVKILELVVYFDGEAS